MRGCKAIDPGGIQSNYTPGRGKIVPRNIIK